MCAYVCMYAYKSVYVCVHICHNQKTRGVSRATIDTHASTDTSFIDPQ